MKDCNRSDENCWFKHELNEEENEEIENSETTKSVFWKLQNKLKNP